jgi:hypothetical protein
MSRKNSEEATSRDSRLRALGRIRTSKAATQRQAKIISSTKTAVLCLDTPLGS